MQQHPPVRVLVVDDDECVREAVILTLEDAGFRTDFAVHGRHALEKLAADVPDLILLDMRMPVMDGPEFRRRQLLDPLIAAVPTVVVSAQPREEVEPLRPDAFVQKPFRADDLIAAVRRLVR